MAVHSKSRPPRKFGPSSRRVIAASQVPNPLTHSGLRVKKVDERSFTNWRNPRNDIDLCQVDRCESRGDLYRGTALRTCRSGRAARKISSRRLRDLSPAWYLCTGLDGHRTATCHSNVPRLGEWPSADHRQSRLMRMFRCDCSICAPVAQRIHAHSPVVTGLQKNRNRKHCPKLDGVGATMFTGDCRRHDSRRHDRRTKWQMRICVTWVQARHWRALPTGRCPPSS